MSLRLAILGHPLGHSLSPVFHTAALQLCGIAGTYEPVDVTATDLSAEWAQHLSTGFDGFNVTIPHKVPIMSLMDSVTEGARTVGAVNTLVREDSGWTGYNTDILGVERVLAPLSGRLAGGEATVIGAGGAARAVVAALIGTTGISRITIINRDRGRADSLAAPWLDRLDSIDILAPEDPDGRAVLARSAIIVQTTPVGMHPHVEESPIAGMDVLTPDHIVFDLIYRPRETRLLRDARAAGATVLGGLEMFLHQAIASFQLWTGVTPPVETIRPLIENALTKS